MTRRGSQSPRRVLIVAVITVAVVVAGALAGYAGTALARRQPDRPGATISVPRALANATGTPSAPLSSAASAAPIPSAVGVSRALTAELGNPGLGGRLLARVADADSAAVLYDSAGNVPAAPASTAKVLDAAALLDVCAPTLRFATTIRAGAAGTVYLVGGGDPTLTGAAVGRAGAYPQAARISTLAAQLKAARVTVRRIVVDDSLFTGASVSPNWAPGDAPSGYAAPITALMVDGGRNRPTDQFRSGTPDTAAAQALARALGRSSLPISSGRAPAGAARLARVYSAAVSVLIEQMLHESDNVIAEVLARHVAIAVHQPPSFAGGAHAIRTVLGKLGVQIGAGMLDASGLSAADRVSPASLVAVLRLIAGATVPALRGIVAALPVAGWSGTLGDRYVSGSTYSAAGRVRAKTGTLTGVSSIAGYVHDRSGRLIVFAFDADRAGSTGAAEAALDEVVSALAGCGCR